MRGEYKYSKIYELKSDHKLALYQTMPCIFLPLVV